MVMNTESRVEKDPAGAAILFAQDGAPVTIGSQLKGRGGRGAAKQKPPSGPTPRWPDGHPLLSAPPGQTGYWDSGFGGLTGKNGAGRKTKLIRTFAASLPAALASSTLLSAF